MNELTLFNNPEFGSVRAMEIDGEVWMVGKDVAENLGYSNASKAVSTHVDDEDKQFFMLDIVDSQNGNVPSGKTKTAIINESGLYSLVISSKMPYAKKFRRWITSEVIPQIMRTGSYSINQNPTTDTSKDRRLDIQEMNAKTRQAKLLLEFAKLDGLSPESRTLLAGEAGMILTGKQLLSLPETEKTYSAGEVGEMLGVSANKIGRIANANGLKTDVYGITVLDTTKNGKQIPTFRYNQNGIDKIKELLKN